MEDIRDDTNFWINKLNFLTFAHNLISNLTNGFNLAIQICGRNLRGFLYEV